MEKWRQGEESRLEYLDEKEVSRRTKKALSTLRNDRHMGRGFPYHKVGRSIRYCWQDVVEYMEHCKVIPEK